MYYSIKKKWMLKFVIIFNSKTFWKIDLCVGLFLVFFSFPYFLTCHS